MDKREAKRRICEDVASRLVDGLAGGEVGLQFSGDDRERYETAAADLAEELLRRAGVWKDGQEVDPRQSTIFDFLEGDA